MHDFTIFLNGIVNIMPSFNCVFHIFFTIHEKRSVIGLQQTEITA